MYGRSSYGSYRWKNIQYGDQGDLLCESGAISRIAREQKVHGNECVTNEPQRTSAGRILKVEERHH